METQASVWFPLQKIILGNSSQNLSKSRYQGFSVLSNFACLSYFCHWLLIKQNLCSWLIPVAFKPQYLNSLIISKCLSSFQWKHKQKKYQESFKFKSFWRYYSAFLFPNIDIRKISNAFGRKHLICFTLFNQNRAISRNLNHH